MTDKGRGTNRGKNKGGRLIEKRRGVDNEEVGQKREVFTLRGRKGEELEGDTLIENWKGRLEKGTRGGKRERE